MSDPDCSNLRDSLVDQSLDVCAGIASLRLAGAEKFDPMGMQYLQVLAQRTSACQGPVKRLLDGKLAQALVAFRERFEHAQGDVKGVRQGITTLKKGDDGSPLGELARDLAQHASAKAQGHLDDHGELRGELKATRYFRHTWSKLSAGKRLTQALDQAPKNAGPINSHRLVLQSLALMREISPDYLNRFTSYVDALLCLEQGHQHMQAGTKKTAGGDHGKKVKSRLSPSR